MYCKKTALRGMSSGTAMEISFATFVEPFTLRRDYMGDKPRTELFTGLADLYHSRDYSDLVLFGKDGERHLVHRAIVCPRSRFLYETVKEGKWRNGNEGHLALPDEDEVVRLMVEYLYLLDYNPLLGPQDDSSSSHADSSDTTSVRTEPGQYGHVYGTSAVSAFGGPANNVPHHVLQSTLFRPRTDSSLTVHALPSTVADFAHFASGPQPRMQRRSANSRGMVTSPPDPSPLATKEPHLTLHVRMYAAAHRYGIGGLKALALDKFKIQLTRHWDSSELAEAIHLVYNTTPSSDKDMREAVADVLGWHGSLLDRPEIEVAVCEIQGLAYELLKRSRRAQPEYME